MNMMNSRSKYTILYLTMLNVIVYKIRCDSKCTYLSHYCCYLGLQHTSIQYQTLLPLLLRWTTTRGL